MEKKTIKDIQTKGKRVLVRVDFNVPMDRSTGEITDDSRIRATLPTIEHLVNQGAKTILASHLGRPDGKVVEKLRLAPVGEWLSKLLGRPVSCTRDCIGTGVEQAVNEMREGDVILLENLRFYPEEEENDPQFSQSLARLADIYVDDAFGAAHRAHASTVGVAQHLPAVAGLLMAKELGFLGKALANPDRPFAMVVGGAKVSDKIGLLENIMKKVDYLIIGGGMANTFLKAQGYNTGSSKVELDHLESARKILDKASNNSVHLLLPTDAVVAKEFSRESEHKTVPISEVPEDWMIMDIGPETAAKFNEELTRCKTVVWNGTMGVFEFPPFAEGTRSIASSIAKLDAMTIIGGGDTAEAVVELGLRDHISHISTGGGASLRFLEGKRLPGVKVLLDK
ncbi:MAG: phosphoglycerate kinase [Chloroflexota bacterium]